MKKIAAIKREVDEIEKRLSQTETMELIRKGDKERLRVNETLMSLLFSRKTVIKKWSRLQERLDAIVIGGGGDEQVLETKETGDRESLGFDVVADVERTI